MRTVSAIQANLDAHALRYGRIVRTFLGMLVFVCRIPAGAQNLAAVPTVRDSGIIRVPVIDQQDIRFKRLSTADGLSQTTR